MAKAPHVTSLRLKSYLVLFVLFISCDPWVLDISRTSQLPLCNFRNLVLVVCSQSSNPHFASCRLMLSSSLVSLFVPGPEGGRAGVSQHLTSLRVKPVGVFLSGRHGRRASNIIRPLKRKTCWQHRIHVMPRDIR